MNAYGIEQIYNGVIDDVIALSREAFLDEGVDIDILHELKNSWETKIQQSGVLNRKEQRKQAKTSKCSEASTNVPAPSQPQPMMPPQQLSRPLLVKIEREQLANPTPLPRLNIAAQIPPTIPYQVSFKQERQEMRQQNAGVMEKGGITAETDKIPQLDGGRPGMMDSSSEDEDGVDDQKGGAKTVNQAEETDHEEDDGEQPLNSDDDLQSDDDDLETIFDVDNVVLCQFEKVTRQRPNTWKFELTNGVMHINGTDYCFNKSTGDAKW